MNAQIGISLATSGVKGMNKGELKKMLEELPEIKLTAEQVRLDFIKWYEGLGSDKARKDLMIHLAASMIYRNGLHKNTGGAIKVSADFTWAQVKDFLGIVESKKVTVTRYLAGVMKSIHDANADPELNLIFRSAAKYELEDDFKAIQPAWAYWGAYYHPDIPLDVARKVYELQQEIIERQKDAIKTAKERS